MALIIADRIKETSTTTGTGTITLAGAVLGFRAFDDVCANGDTVNYCIANPANGEWEVGTGTWVTGGTLTRSAVLASSNAGALVNFSAGTKDVFQTMPAALSSPSYESVVDGSSPGHMPIIPTPNRSSVATPTSYKYSVGFEFKASSACGITDLATFTSLQTIAGYSGTTVSQLQVAYTTTENAGSVPAMLVHAGTDDTWNAWWTVCLIDPDGAIRLKAGTTDPAAPASGLKIYAKTIAGRTFPKWIGPSGLDQVASPHMAFNQIAFWNPPGNTTTVPGVFGMASYSTVGTITTRSVATTRLFTRLRRLGHVSAATAGSLGGARVAAAQYTLGTGMGGFFKCIRFGCSDATTVVGARQFVGMTSSVAAPANVEPSTLTNCIGVGHGAADTNLQIYYGGSAAQTPINLGANFPANTLSIDVYELVLFAKPAADNTVYYRVTCLNTGYVAEGTLTAATAGVQLPANTTLLAMTQVWRTNNATALAVGLDIMSDYIETDY